MNVIPKLPTNVKYLLLAALPLMLAIEINIASHNVNGILDLTLYAIVFCNIAVAIIFSGVQIYDQKANSLISMTVIASLPVITLLLSFFIKNNFGGCASGIFG